MSQAWRQGSDRVAELRQAFDRSFAEPPRSEAAGEDDLLDIKVGGTAYAVRVVEIAGVYADVAITPLPTHLDELLGITAFRGAVLPVFDLRALTGHRADTPPRWVAVAAAAPIALAFDRFDGHLRVSRDDVVPHDGREAVAHVREVARLDGRVRPVVSIASVVDAIANRVGTVPREKES